MTKYLLPAFIVVVLIQLYVPAKMVWDSNAVVTSGKTFKFKTRPIDPNDPFRGKYVILNYEANHVDINNAADYDYDETVYVTLKNDDLGYVEIDKVSKSTPKTTSDYVIATVNRTTSYQEDSIVLFVDYPFDRFYMEETKAKPAEEAVAESSREEGKTAYAVVKVKNGQTVIEDVMIDGISVKEMVE